MLSLWFFVVLTTRPSFLRATLRYSPVLDDGTADSTSQVFFTSGDGIPSMDTSQPLTSTTSTFTTTLSFLPLGDGVPAAGTSQVEFALGDGIPAALGVGIPAEDDPQVDRADAPQADRARGDGFPAVDDTSHTASVVANTSVINATSVSHSVVWKLIPSRGTAPSWTVARRLGRIVGLPEVRAPLAAAVTQFSHTFPALILNSQHKSQATSIPATSTNNHHEASPVPTRSVLSRLGRHFHSIAMLMFFLPALAVCHMWQPGGGAQSSRLPPRWEPASNVSFRSWTQDLMLWTISSDLQPHQQCALIISQLGGAARDVARTLTPNEVYAGGFVNGQQVDPITYLLHGLSQRFAPLDDELRLRATQDLLGFSRRGNETVDALISRFEIVRQRARIEGGGAVSIETASLMLLKAVGVSPEQFQSLTQPFGLRLPNTEDEFLQLTHHLRRMGHIVERSQLNIASTLNRTSQHHWTNEQQAYQAEENPPTSAFMPEDQPSGWGDGPSDWAYATGVAEEEASWTDSATSSDQEGYLVDTQDLRGMTNQQADEYLFGRYQDAKRRWRRFTGKPVRHLRKVFRRKGKGKGKGKGSRSFLNLSETLEQSAYFKGKGKGGRSSGKGFGRRMNPKGRDGEVLKCSVCNSMYHLRARCPQQSAQQSSAAQSSSQPAGHIGAAARAPSMYADSGLHFVAGHTEHFMSTAQSEASWTNVNDPAVETPRSRVAEPEVHPMTPTVDHVFEQDPWMQWHQRQQSEAQIPELPLPRPGATIAPSFSMPAPSVSIASPCMFMPMPAAQAATPAAVRRPNWDWPGLSFQPPQATPAPAIEPPSAVTGLFTQVNMLRSSNPSLLNAPARPSAPPEDPPNTRLYQDTCTICQTIFAPMDHVCRTTCRHVYHSLCIGELIQHAGETSFECPNCRVPTEVDHSWQFPDLAAAQPQVTEELPLPSAGHSVAADDEAVRTPVPSEHGTDFEWQTPEGVESSFPWWPVPSHDEEAEQSAFLTSTVRMPNGSLGLLVDPGSYGNLCGEGWATEASEEAKKHGYSVDVSDRETPLNVGGIGRGSQVCKKDVVLPAVIGRSDGSYQAGTFQAPVIEGSSAPALLGLKA